MNRGGRALASLAPLFALACGGHSDAPDRGPDSFGPTSNFAATITAPPNDPTVAYFTTPSFGAVGTGQTVTFAWTAVTGALGYELQVGTTLFAKNLYDSGEISSLTTDVSGLPANGIVYAQVRAIVPGDPVNEPAGHWIHGSNIVLRTDTKVASAVVTSPLHNSLTAGAPIVWIPDPVAIAYRLRVGTTQGGNDVDDSGTIHVNQRLVNVPTSATTLYGTLDTVYSSGTVSHAFTFQNQAGATTTAARVAVARSLAAQVRAMANVDNQPEAGTLIFVAASLAERGAATCADYTTALLAAIEQANVGLQARRVDVCLSPNSYDCHELVEVLDPDSGRWFTLDSTFGIETLRADGVPATIAEISAAARTMNFSALTFDFLTTQGNSYATGYYIDYPLLFVDVYSRTGSGLDQAMVTDLLPYFTVVPGPVVDNWGPYALQCASGYSTLNVNKDGAMRSFNCTNGTGITQIVYASSLSAIPGDPSMANILRPNRYVF